MSHVGTFTLTNVGALLLCVVGLANLKPGTIGLNQLSNPRSKGAVEWLMPWFLGFSSLVFFKIYHGFNYCKLVLSLHVLPCWREPFKKTAIRYQKTQTYGKSQFLCAYVRWRNLSLLSHKKIIMTWIKI